MILAVKARELHACGTPFFLTTNNVWLVEAVPPPFIEVLETTTGTGERHAGS